MNNHGRQKHNQLLRQSELPAFQLSANNCLQRTRGTIRAASVRAMALAFETER